MVHASLKAFLLPNRFRPYLEAGAKAQIIRNHHAEIRINQELVELNEKEIDHEVSPFAAVGIRADIIQQLYVDLVINYGKLPGSDWAPAVGIYLGVRL